MNYTDKDLGDTPRLLEFQRIGQLELGYLTSLENSKLPFTIKRVYWTYFTPHSVTRGHHAHLELKQLIFAVSGSIEITLENIFGEKKTYQLESPNSGLFVPKLHWRTIKMSHNAVLLCLASEEYDESDYIRNYAEFEKLKDRKE